MNNCKSADPNPVFTVGLSVEHGNIILENKHRKVFMVIMLFQSIFFCSLVHVPKVYFSLGKDCHKTTLYPAFLPTVTSHLWSAEEWQRKVRLTHSLNI